MRANVTPYVLLDDGEFRVTLDADSRRGSDVADGFLERRTLSGRRVRVGEFVMMVGGHWMAALSTPITPRADTGQALVIDGVQRFDAIVALWQARRQAFLGDTL